jgi:hypothetical protein
MLLLLLLLLLLVVVCPHPTAAALWLQQMRRTWALQTRCVCPASTDIIIPSRGTGGMLAALLGCLQQQLLCCCLQSRRQPLPAKQLQHSYRTR